MLFDYREAIEIIENPQSKGGIMAIFGKGTMNVVIGVALGTLLAGFLGGLINKR